jgi:hypothetical protein
MLTMENLIRTQSKMYLKHYPKEGHHYLVVEIGDFQASILIQEITAQEFIKVGVEQIVITQPPPRTTSPPPTNN